MANQLRGERRQSFALTVCPAELDRGGCLAFDITGVREALPERGDATAVLLCNTSAEEADDRQLPLLRPRRPRPRRRRGAEEGDELASLHHMSVHSITSSARTIMRSG